MTYAIIALVVLATVIVVIYLFLTNRKISKEYEKLVEENKRVQVADNIISAYNIADADKNDL
jgi:CHASE3 domain sensor protein